MHPYLNLLFLIVGCFAQNNSGIGNVGPKVASNVNNANNNKDSILNNYGATSLNNFGTDKSNDGISNDYGRSVIFNDVNRYSENINIGSLLDRLYKIENPLNVNVYNSNAGQKSNSNSTFEIDAGNPDTYAKIQRPCEVYDLYCMRNFFAKHSRCRISKGPVPDPFYRARFTANYPRVNMSVMQTNIEYRGLNNARVEQFYINTATDNLVIALEFDAVSMFSNSTYLKFYLRGREPVITRDFGGSTYDRITVTAVIPQINDLRLDKAEMHAYLGNPIFTFVIGPGLVASTDPAVPIMFAEFASNVRDNQQEAFLTEGNFYAATYIQNNICDFGLKVV